MENDPILWAEEWATTKERKTSIDALGQQKKEVNFSSAHPRKQQRCKQANGKVESTKPEHLQTEC